MQIKFNKLVKPVAPQMEDMKPLDAVNPSPAPVKPEPVKLDPPKNEAAQKTGNAKPVAALDAVEAALAQAAPAAPAAPVTPAAAPSAPVVQQSAGAGIEESLREFIGQTIRVYMADHESLNGRLEAVEDGWIKMSNVRSAADRYYSDEDIISTSCLVRAHTTRTVDKEYYVDFMNTKN